MLLARQAMFIIFLFFLVLSCSAEPQINTKLDKYLKEIDFYNSKIMKDRILKQLTNPEYCQYNLKEYQEFHKYYKRVILGLQEKRYSDVLQIIDKYVRKKKSIFIDYPTEKERLINFETYRFVGYMLLVKTVLLYENNQKTKGIELYFLLSYILNKYTGLNESNNRDYSSVSTLVLVDIFGYNNLANYLQRFIDNTFDKDEIFFSLIDKYDYSIKNHRLLTPNNPLFTIEVDYLINKHYSYKNKNPDSDYSNLENLAYFKALEKAMIMEINPDFPFEMEYFNNFDEKTTLRIEKKEAKVSFFIIYINSNDTLGKKLLQKHILNL